MKSMKVYTPDGRVGPPLISLASAPRVLAGQRIVALDNGKPGAARILRTIGERLAARTGATFGEIVQKGSAATPCEPELFEEIVGRADVILTASAD